MLLFRDNFYELSKITRLMVHKKRKLLTLVQIVERLGGSLSVMQFASSPVLEPVHSCLCERESFAEYKNNRVLWV